MIINQHEPVTTVQETEFDYYNLKSTLLVQYKDSIEAKTIPQTSDIACFWCCHTPLLIAL